MMAMTTSNSMRVNPLGEENWGQECSRMGLDLSRCDIFCQIEPCLFQWLPSNARVVVESHPGHDFTGSGSSGQCNRLQNNHLQFGAGGGTRTHTAFYSPRILSPVCLPFHHTGSRLRAITYDCKRGKRLPLCYHLSYFNAVKRNA